MTDTSFDAQTLRPALLRRQSSVRKHDAVRRAAAELFMTHGFGGVSMDAIAEAAGVAKRTLYSHFENKYALFAAVIEERCSGVLAVPPSEDEIQRAELAPLLERIAIDFLTAIYSPEQIELLRTVIADAKAFPEIGAMMMDGPFHRSEQIVRKLLLRRVSAGELVLPRPELAATQFLGMLKTDLQFRLLLRATPPTVSAHEIRRIARATVSLFLHGASSRKTI